MKAKSTSEKSEKYWRKIKNLSLKVEKHEDEHCPRYGSKTLVSGWYMGTASLPYDNDISIRTMSAYRRLGTFDEPVAKRSSSQEDQISALTIKQCQPKDRKLSMINFITFPATCDERRRTGFKLAGLVQQHPNINKTDYKSVMKFDYHYPNPRQFKKIISADCTKVPTKHRRVNTDPMTCEREGLRMFLDDDMELLYVCKDRERKPYPYAFHHKPEETWKVIRSEYKNKAL